MINLILRFGMSSFEVTIEFVLGDLEFVLNHN
jgi:hypothetical protein